MHEITFGVIAGVIANFVYPTLIAILALVLNKFTAKVVNVQTNLLHRDWIARLAVSAFFNMISFLLLAYVFAVVYKWRGVEMPQGLVYGMLMIGASSPPINFVVFLFLAPKKLGEAAITGVMSLLFTYGYLIAIVAIYQIAFKLMEGLPGV